MSTFWEECGASTECDQCGNKCAFIKPQSVKDKFGEKNLCYLCRLSYDKNDRKNNDESNYETLPIEKQENDISNIVGMPMLNLMKILTPRSGASNEELQNVKLH